MIIIGYTAPSESRLGCKENEEVLSTSQILRTGGSSDAV